MISENAFSVLGTGQAKAMYEGIEDQNRFSLVLDTLRENEQLEKELGTHNLEWPQEESHVNTFFNSLSPI